MRSMSAPNAANFLSKSTYPRSKWYSSVTRVMPSATRPASIRAAAARKSVAATSAPCNSDGRFHDY